MKNIGIGVYCVADRWRVCLTINGIDYRSSQLYATKEDVGIDLAKSFPEMSAEMLASILKSAYRCCSEPTKVLFRS